MSETNRSLDQKIRDEEFMRRYCEQKNVDRLDRWLRDAHDATERSLGRFRPRNIRTPEPQLDHHPNHPEKE